MFAADEMEQNRQEECESIEGFAGARPLVPIKCQRFSSTEGESKVTNAKSTFLNE